MLDGVGYANYSNATRVASGETPRYVVNGGSVFSFLSNPDGTPSTTVDTTPATLYNWQDEVYQQGVSSSFGATFSAGNDDGDFYLSAGFNDLNGLIDNSSFKTGDIRLNTVSYTHLKMPTITNFYIYFLSV